MVEQAFTDSDRAIFMERRVIAKTVEKQFQWRSVWWNDYCTGGALVSEQVSPYKRPLENFNAWPM